MVDRHGDCIGAHALTDRSSRAAVTCQR